MGSEPRMLLAAGSNAKGQLGIGSCDDAHTFMPCQFAGCGLNQLPDRTARVVDIACGANHTIVLLEHLDGSTTLWGAGDWRRGQLGPGYGLDCREGADEAPWTIFHQVILAGFSGEYRHARIAAAWETTYVVLSCPPGSAGFESDSDVLLAMGSNAFGALGVGEETDGSAVQIQRLGEPRVVVLDHVFPAEDLGHRTIHVRSLHAGPRHIIAELVMTSGNAGGSCSHSETALVGWGASRHGQLGQNGGARFLARPIRLQIDVQADPLVSYALGSQHTVVLHASGLLSALGSNKQGQIPPLCDGSRWRVSGLGCTWNGTFMQAVDGNEHVLLSMGNNAQGQLGRGHTEESSSAVDGTVGLPVDCGLTNFVCGSEHVLVATSNSSQEGDSVLGWGWNEHGNMGLGSLGNVTTPTQLWPRNDVEVYKKYPQRVIGIWAGCATSWLLVE